MSAVSLARRRAFAGQHSRADAVFTDVRARAGSRYLRRWEHMCDEHSPREAGPQRGCQREATLLSVVPRSIGSPESPLLEVSISSTQTKSIFEGVF